MARVEQQPTYVLHQRHYRETSLLIDVLTQDYGRISLIAKGAKRPKSPYRGLLQPFALNYIDWVGRSQLLTLIGIERSQSVTFSGKILYCGLYLNELIMRLTQPQDTHEGLFADYHQALAHLASATNIEWGLRLFEKRLLQRLGYGLLLHTEAHTGAPLEADQMYRYVHELGPILLDEQAGLIIHGSSLIALQQEIPHRRALLECKQLMRFILDHLLGHQPLHSRSLFQPITSHHQ